MSTQTMLFVLLLMLMGGLFHSIPGLTRPDLFFAVTVAPAFRGSSDAQRILRRYRAMVWNDYAGCELAGSGGRPWQWRRCCSRRWGI